MKERNKGDGEQMNLRSAGLDVAPVGAVDLVHLGKVAHVGQEDVDLDDLLEAGAGGFEDGGQVLDALVLLGNKPLVFLLLKTMQDKTRRTV